MQPIKPNSKIAVGLSGGVDSAITAAILKKQGHEVIGVHMRRTDLGMKGCTAKTDLADAKAVADHLGVPFKLYDFRDEYKRRIIDRFIAEYQSGRTPNPDIWCNEVMKFGLFMGKALGDLGVDYVATGHYARIKQRNPESGIKNQGEGIFVLKSGVDETKDQSYFLYRLNQDQLSKAIFPLGGMLKEEVRILADQLNLPVAEKPDSVGICFIGDINLKEFLKEKIDFRPGEVVNTAGEVIGRHDGVQFYTIGQRHGFRITEYQGDPVYVIDKDLQNNRLVVGRDEESDIDSFTLTDLHFIDPNFQFLIFSDQLKVRVRHLGSLIPCKADRSPDPKFKTENLKLRISLNSPARGVAPGQHAVFYHEDEVLGGGVVKSFKRPH